MAVIRKGLTFENRTARHSHHPRCCLSVRHNFTRMHRRPSVSGQESIFLPNVENLR